MAQVETSTRSRSRKGRHIRKAIFVDLTPMVDLAFLLITFFMLTTSLRESHSMDLLMPIKSPVTMAVPESRMITFIADGGEQLFYYYGNNSEQIHPTDYSTRGMRAVLFENIKRVKTNFGNDQDLICFLKVSDDANYQNLVNMLDEMVITEIKHYAIRDLTIPEMESLNNQSKKK